MSIARTLEGKLSATLAILTIIGWIVVAVVEVYPEHRPDMYTMVIIVVLAIDAYNFYKQDKATKPKQEVEAGVEVFLQKLALHLADMIKTIDTGNKVMEKALEESKEVIREKLENDESVLVKIKEPDGQSGTDLDWG